MLKSLSVGIIVFNIGSYAYAGQYSKKSYVKRYVNHIDRTLTKKNYLLSSCKKYYKGLLRGPVIFDVIIKIDNKGDVDHLGHVTEITKRTKSMSRCLAKQLYSIKFSPFKYGTLKIRKKFLFN